MRIAVTGDNAPGVMYRANDPLQAMLRRGHEVVWPVDANGGLDPEQVLTCDVLHVYGFCNEPIRQLAEALISRGVALTWDHDNDYFGYSPEFPPPFDPECERIAGIAQDTVEMARLAHVATFPSERLADVYRSHGVERVEVIESAPRAGFLPRRPHPGVVVGWIAGAEHESDLRQLPIVDALRRLQSAHPDVHVEAIGIDLGLPERYTHTEHVPFDELPRRMAGFDIGIAPLADHRFNHGRSNIKIKEYAAAGVPWLASPLSPYLPHGEEHGGRLVPDDGWFDALDRLVRDRQERQGLGVKARAWGKTQRIEAVADRWEAVFERAASLVDRSLREA